MELFQIDDTGHLFISPDVDDWAPVEAAGVDVVIDMDEGLDAGVAQQLHQGLYVFFPFDDTPRLPSVDNLHAVGQMGASLIRSGRRVLSHCGLGHNRSALVAGVILYHLGFPTKDIVPRIQARRTGALYNHTFRNFLEGLA